MRYAFLMVLAVGLFGVARVLFGASGDRVGDEWMRWTPSVNLASLADGDRRRLDWNGRSWFVRALDANELASAGTRDPADLVQPTGLQERLLRIEIGTRTRWFAVLAAESAECIVAATDNGWRDACGGRYDLAGRALREGGAGRNLAIPDFVIRTGTLHLHPNQPN